MNRFTAGFLKQRAWGNGWWILDFILVIVFGISISRWERFDESVKVSEIWWDSKILVIKILYGRKSQCPLISWFHLIIQNCLNLFFLAGLIKSHMVLRPCLSSLVLPMLHIRFYKVLVQLRQPRLIDVLNLFPKRWNSEGFPAFFASGASRLLKLKLFSPDLLF